MFIAVKISHKDCPFSSSNLCLKENVERYHSWSWSYGSWIYNYYGSWIYNYLCRLYLSKCFKYKCVRGLGTIVMVFNATFNNISAISWGSVILVEETGVPGENPGPVVSHWQTLSHNYISGVFILWSLFFFILFLCLFVNVRVVHFF
jgi:hypothetical protein